MGAEVELVDFPRAVGETDSSAPALVLFTEREQHEIMNAATMPAVESTRTRARDVLSWSAQSQRPRVTSNTVSRAGESSERLEGPLHFLLGGY
jgi:hypothetical protein